MQAVDVLGDHSLDLAHFFELGQRNMTAVGFGLGIDHLVSVKFIEFFGVVDEKAVGHHFFRREGGVELLAVNAARRSEIRNAGSRRNAGAAKEDDVVAFPQNFR